MCGCACTYLWGDVDGDAPVAGPAHRLVLHLLQHKEGSWFGGLHAGVIIYQDAYHGQRPCQVVGEHELQVLMGPDREGDVALQGLRLM